MNLTFRAYLFIAGICLLGIIGQWSGGGQEHYWRVFAAAMIVALVLEKSVFHKERFTVSRELPLHAYLGRRLTYLIRIRNPGHRPLRLATQDGLPENVVSRNEVIPWRIPAGAEAIKSNKFTPVQLGELKWNNLYLRALGLLHLANWSKKVIAESSIMVVPDYLHPSEVSAANQRQGDLHRRYYGSGFELIGLRDFQPGDALRHIDWKASARSGSPKLRIFTEEQKLELTILVDVGRASGLEAGSLTRVGHYVNIAARLAEKVLRDGNEVNLLGFSNRPLNGCYHARGTKGLLAVRGLLSQLSTTEADSNPLAAILEVRRRVRQRNLVVILTDLDESATDDQLTKAVAMLTPKHVPLVASIVDEETLELEKASAQNWIDPYMTLAAYESLQGCRRAALHMQQRGAHVVFTRPALLDKAVMDYYTYLLDRRRI
ncbi:MAG: DUF58 domain-containing protein [Gammaproteobacteria bacterium]|nr:DUF58 domain-containing protein [Gammaproteobacteria bacterium]